MSRRGPAPLRTCLGCRRVRPQPELLRVYRQGNGQIEPDPSRRAGGRGAYLCRREACLRECARKGRWTHAFRAPAVATPEAIARLRELLNDGQEGPVAVEGGS